MHGIAVAALSAALSFGDTVLWLPDASFVDQSGHGHVVEAGCSRPLPLATEGPYDRAAIDFAGDQFLRVPADASLVTATALAVDFMARTVASPSALGHAIAALAESPADRSTWTVDVGNRVAAITIFRPGTPRVVDSLVYTSPADMAGRWIHWRMTAGLEAGAIVLSIYQDEQLVARKVTEATRMDTTAPPPVLIGWNFTGHLGCIQVRNTLEPGGFQCASLTEAVPGSSARVRAK